MNELIIAKNSILQDNTKNNDLTPQDYSAKAKVYSTSIIFITILMALLINFDDTNKDFNKETQDNQHNYSKELNTDNGEK